MDLSQYIYQMIAILKKFNLCIIIYMKDLKDIIFEKILINKDTEIQSSLELRQSRKNWSIDKAEDGDIIYKGSNLYFIYKCVNDKKYSIYSSEDAIIYHICGNPVTKRVSVGPDCGVGLITDNKNNFKLASVEQCKVFLDFLKEKGYKWDDKNKKIIQN